MSTLLQMQTRLRTIIGSPSVGNVPDATLTEMINLGYRQIATRYRFHRNRVKATFQTVATTATYNLNAADLIVYEVWNKTNGYRLKKVDHLNLFKVDDSVAYPTNTGRPRMYYRDGITLVLYPTPDAVYTIEMITQRDITDLSVAGDVPILPVTWHEAIVLWARWQYFDSIVDYPKAQYAYNALQQWLQTRPNEFDEENQAFREAVEIPTLTNGRRGSDFDTSEW